jgi:hypothetical protein
MLQILSVTPFEHVPLVQLLTDMGADEISAHDPNQMNLF